MNSKKGEPLINLKNIILALFLSISTFAQPGLIAAQANGTKSEVKIMKKRILQISAQQYSGLNESYYKHQLAYTQAALLKKDITLLILEVYRQYGTTKRYKDIYDAVDVSFENAFIFPDLGTDHVDRFTRIVTWAKAETNFQKNNVSSWKKGTYLKSINATVNKDTSDWGMWQINEDNFKYVKKINYLYSSGVITYKVKKIRSLEDLLDIKTNCAARCLIETDRKDMHMEWRHNKEMGFFNKISLRIKSLEKERVYDRALVERYYHLTAVKTYKH
jgi:hypothetical protein